MRFYCIELLFLRVDWKNEKVGRDMSDFTYNILKVNVSRNLNLISNSK